MEKQTIDPHLLYIAKNTSPLQRMMWWKKNLDFWKKIRAKTPPVSRLKGASKF
jgi:hypothetical protein